MMRVLQLWARTHIILWEMDIWKAAHKPSFNLSKSHISLKLVKRMEQLRGDWKRERKVSKYIKKMVF